MCYTFSVEDADEFLTPHASGEVATHALKCRDRVDDHTSMTTTLGLTTDEMVDLHRVLSARLKHVYMPGSPS
jgi:hypothetical protein